MIAETLGKWFITNPSNTKVTAKSFKRIIRRYFGEKADQISAKDIRFAFKRCKPDPSFNNGYLFNYDTEYVFVRKACPKPLFGSYSPEERYTRHRQAKRRFISKKMMQVLSDINLK